MIWHRKDSQFWSSDKRYEIALSTRGFQLWHHGGTAETYYVLGRELTFEQAKARAERHRGEAAVSGREPAAASVTVVAESGVPS